MSTQSCILSKHQQSLKPDFIDTDINASLSSLASQQLQPESSILTNNQSTSPQINSRKIQNPSSPTNTTQISILSTSTQAIQPISKIKSLITDEKLFEVTHWESINRYNTNNHNSKPLEPDLIDKETWIEECIDSLENDELPIIPILSNKPNYNNIIEYIKIIKIDYESAFVGVGIIYYVTEKLLYGYLARYYQHVLISNDIIKLIMKYCLFLRVSSIHLDPEYITNQHELLLKSQKSVDYVDVAKYKPFLSELEISKSGEGIYMNFQIGETMSVPSEWDQDDDAMVDRDRGN